MNKVLSILLFLLLSSGAVVAQTVEVIMPCIDANTTFTFTLAGTDVGGRNFYEDESINGVGNAAVQVFYLNGEWVIGIPNANASDILYSTGANLFAPNPPSSAAGAWMPTAASGCDFAGNATVSGTGTQDMEGMGCDDEDMDTVCDDEDICPGEDDRIDEDNDGIPACVDGEDDTVFDGITFNSDCFGSIGFILSGNDGTRNTYANAMQGLVIAYNPTDMRWELRSSIVGGTVIYTNETNSGPNPPSSTASAWAPTDSGGCSDDASPPTVGGSGTQDCTDSDGCNDDLVFYQETDTWYPSIGDAVTAIPAATPATLYIMSGNYSEDVSTAGKQITLRFGPPPVD